MRFTHLIWSLMLLASVSRPAAAELVFFADGRTMSVKAHRVEGATLVLTLRSGGEISCEQTGVARIAPDEVAHDEEAESTAANASSAARRPEPRDLAPAAQAYAPIIEAAAARHGVDPQLVHAVIQVESGYQPNARSRKGAMGLMQLMPKTAREYKVVDPYDPVANIEAGVAYLSALLSRLPRDLALAAYNAGEASVQRFRGLPPYAETRQYVARILQLAGR